MNNSIENISNSVKKVGSLDDLLDFNNNSKKKKANMYIPKCLCGFSNLTLIGSGAFSVVFSAYHLLDKNTYALKCIPLPDKKEIIKDKSREILFLSRLCHPNIIRYYNSWLEYIPNKIPKFITNHISEIDSIQDNLDIFLFIQMEKVDITLKSFIENTPISNNQIKLIILQIIEGLEYLHSEKVVHCDLKPDNISLKIEGNNFQVKIMDFGIAGVLGIPNINYKYYGNSLYIAPEMDSTNYLPIYESDIYSLGVIIYELLYPCYTQSEKIQNIIQWKDTHEKTNKSIISYESSLLPIINQMIRIDPLERPSLHLLKRYIKMDFNN